MKLRRFKFTDTFDNHIMYRAIWDSWMTKMIHAHEMGCVEIKAHNAGRNNEGQNLITVVVTRVP